jgi:hypothetical protein
MVVLEQIGRLQIFVRDRIVLADNGKRCLLVEVSALALHLQVLLRQQYGRFPATAASLLAACDAPLRRCAVAPF